MKFLSKSEELLLYEDEFFVYQNFWYLCEFPVIQILTIKVHN